MRAESHTLFVVAISIIVLLPAGCYVVPEEPAGGCEQTGCAEGEECIDGQCLQNDTDTSTETDTDAGTGTEPAPEPEAECAIDADCADGWMCELGFCAAAPPGSACSTDSDCVAGSSCVEGICVPGESTPSCTTDGDCAEDEECVDGSCQAAAPDRDDLEVANPNVPFDALVVGQTYELAAPDPVESDQGAADDGGASEPVASAQAGTVSGDCSCVWSVEPTGVVELDPGDECTTGLTVIESGLASLTVVVSCDTAQGTFTQDIEAVTGTVTCTFDDDCGEGEACTDGVCAPRVGPTVELLTDRTRPPFVVSLDLRLEDVSGDAISDGVLREHFRIFEDDVEIDYDETGYFATSAPDLPHRIVLVLDYTGSMASAGAIDSMVMAAKQFMVDESLTSSHSVGIVEFHDRTDVGAGYSTAVPLTVVDEAGKAQIIIGIPLSGDLESGMSRVWDAVELAAAMLKETERQPGEVRSIVFLTDGRDTTSTADPEALKSTAVAEEIKLYPIGFGDVGPTESMLREFADDTGGIYFAADDGGALRSAFQRIALQLRGQWNLRYITQKNTGSVNLRLEFTWLGQTGVLDHSFNAAEADGDIHEGVIEVLERSYDATTDRTEFLLRADYMPRNVSRFRFAFAQEGTTLTLSQSGGLTDSDDGWILQESENSLYELYGPAPLGFGSFGDIGTASVPGKVDALQVTHDDTMLDFLAQPKTIAFAGDSWLLPKSLEIIMDPLGGGIVVATPSKPGYGTGETVTLTAFPSGDHVFQQWLGGATGTDFSTTVTMDDDVSVTAMFYPPRILTTVVSPAGAGTITRDPNRSTYRQGETVTLTAVPNGTTFSAWSGAATGSSASVTITMSGDLTVTATFVTP